MTSSEGFQQNFSIISKIVCCGFYMKKNVAFAVLKWDEYLSVQLPFELLVQIPVQLLLELELNWLVQNVNELEFELSRMYLDETTHWRWVSMTVLAWNLNVTFCEKEGEKKYGTCSIYSLF